jgi:hypothetical protein
MTDSMLDDNAELASALTQLLDGGHSHEDQGHRHDHGGHGHTHGLVDPSIKRSRGRACAPSSSPSWCLGSPSRR